MAPSSVTSVILLCSILRGVTAASASDNYAAEKVAAYWYDIAQEELEASMKDRHLGVAKNVILFIGDGMGPTTVTAARILAGQKMGGKGEEYKLSFDKFPYTGLSKTYNTDSQITDSAASATAFLCGVKTNQGVLGLLASATRGMCNTTEGAEVNSILRWSAQAGKSTGVVTSTRITHATPAASYAHSPDRDWESDKEIPESEKAECEDIAYQLIKRNSDINVIMGGGRAYFYPEGFDDPDPDPEFNITEVSRLDGLNLVEEWKNDKASRNLKHKFVYNKQGLDAVNVAETDYLLGLFTQGHLNYEVDKDRTKEPTLAEIVEKAVRILSKNDKGFFLLVEGGRIDHAHHDTNPYRSLHEVVAMADAVDMAAKLTKKEETLIVVSADHSHVMGIAGYASRGNPILGVSDLNGVINLERTLDGLPFTTIVYGNGPGYNSTRQNVSEVDTEDKEYVSQSAVPMDSETHGGEDVVIYATGPQSFLYTGVHEQSYIPMVMAYASCVGPYAEGQKKCAKYQKTWDLDELCKDANTGMMTSSSFLSLTITLGFYYLLKLLR